MAFDYAEYQAFVQLLYKHPELRAEVRKLVLSDDILTLPQVVRELSVTVKELAEAQKRSEERLTRLETAVAELAEAQKRTEQRVEELAEAQKRSEERLTRLETAVAELAEAQKRTEQRMSGLEERVTRVEQRMDSLETEMKKTRSEVARLTSVFGSTLEEEAASVLKAVLHQKGYRLLTEEASLAWNGEVDVLLMAETPEGRRLSIVVESKARLSERDVNRWYQRIQSEAWQKQLQAAGYPGPYLFYFYAIRADVGAQKALKNNSIGLLKSEGEVIAPASEIGG